MTFYHCHDMNSLSEHHRGDLLSKPLRAEKGERKDRAPARYSKLGSPTWSSKERAQSMLYQPLSKTKYPNKLIRTLLSG